MTAAAAPAQMLAWSSDNHRRLETVRAVITERGLRANGYIIRGGEPAYGVSYSVLVDAQGRTRRLTVQSDVADGERHLSLTRTPGGPWVVESAAGSSPMPTLDAALDIDLQTSAFTNSLVLRRTGLTAPDVEAGTQVVVVVARVHIPSLTIEPVEHTYTALGEGRVDYTGSLGEMELTVDASGFVLDFPDLSHRIR